MIAEYELYRESDERMYVSIDKDGACPNHFHRKIELLYVTDGDKIINCDGVKYHLYPDQIFIAYSYAMHSYEENPNGKQIILVLPNHLLKDYYLLYGHKKFSKCIIQNKEKCKRLKHLFLSLVDKKSNPLICQGSIDLLMGKLVEELKLEDRAANYNQTFTEEVLAYINENYKENITLDSLSKHFGYSKYYFSRMFNSTLKTNITNYISIVRLQAVLRRLQAGDCNVSTAAYEAGFSSMQTFYRELKKNYDYKKVKDIICSKETQTDYNKYIGNI